MAKLSKTDYFRIKNNIIKKLYSGQCFNQGHMLYERLTSGIPSHLKGFVKIMLEELLKEELVLIYGRTKYGAAYQLNIKKLKEIEEILDLD
ncbi:MAG: hypothetical protein KAQ83_03530 [Nanoarchaeota archaeon]|nr:hypothetical protein [Nanoarchaeota archaeon]